jgi:hypothetical protein
MRFRRESAQVVTDHSFRADRTRPDLAESRSSRSYGEDTGQAKSLMWYHMSARSRKRVNNSG